MLRCKCLLLTQSEHTVSVTSPFTRRLWALRAISPASHLAYSFRQVRPAASSTNLGFDGMHVGVGTKLRRPDELSQFVNDGIRDNVPYDLNFDRTGIPKEFTLHRVITEVFYIGLGDQFDDDRRRIRASSVRSCRQPAVRGARCGVDRTQESSLEDRSDWWHGTQSARHVSKLRSDVSTASFLRSALGHKRTFRSAIGMSALPPKATGHATRKCPLVQSGHIGVVCALSR